MIHAHGSAPSKRVFLCTLFLIAIVLPNTFLIAQQQSVDRAAVLAAEEFRRGVQAFNRFAFNESILSLEKALSWKPEEPLILNWLGRSYYRSGLEDTALRQWQAALEFYPPTGADGLQLGGWVETVKNRRSLYPELDENARYVDAGRYPGQNGDLAIFSQPSSVLANDDGSVWVVAYGSNELVRIDPNGIVRARVRGPLNGFDRPYDLARGLDGRLYVSEYKGNRVSILDKNGAWKAYIGSKGRGDGQFVGPQHVAVDPEGYLYVVDFGNRRVLKFDPDGVFVLGFGAKGRGFDGFLMPTGVAAIEDEVFVADAARARIVRFDRSGNFLGYIAEGELSNPESLRVSNDGKLLVADTRRIVLVDPATGLLRELGGLGNAKVRIVCADSDRNGNIAAADFGSNEVALLARMDDLSSGLFVQIERVVSDRFPEITVDVNVQDRRRRPIVGLDQRNFLLSEGGRPIAGQTFLGASYLASQVEIAILVERSELTASRTSEIVDAVRDLKGATDTLKALISAGEQPVKERIAQADILASSRSVPAAYSRRWKFDLGLRLAATELLAGAKKRAVFFVSSGKMGEKAFERYGLSELAAYLANNGIAFYAAILSDEVPDRELTYLCAQTGGQLIRVYRPSGLAPALEALRSAPNGSYSLKYTSSLATDFGRAYLPVEAEAYLLTRSGRDAIGYFPPLE